MHEALTYGAVEEFSQLIFRLPPTFARLTEGSKYIYIYIHIYAITFSLCPPPRLVLALSLVCVLSLRVCFLSLSLSRALLSLSPLALVSSRGLDCLILGISNIKQSSPLSNNNRFSCPFASHPDCTDTASASRQWYRVVKLLYY